MRACTEVLVAVAAALAALPALTIVDLACGTGSMLRAPCATSASVAKREACGQRPRPVGASRRRVPSRARSDNHANRCCARSQSGTRSFARSGQAPLIVSDSWLELLVTDVAARPLPFYAAVTYDGRITFEPSGPLECGDHRRRWRPSSSRQGIWTSFGRMPQETNNRNVRSVGTPRPTGDEATRWGHAGGLNRRVPG